MWMSWRCCNHGRCLQTRSRLPLMICSLSLLHPIPPLMESQIRQGKHHLTSLGMLKTVCILLPNLLHCLVCYPFLLFQMNLRRQQATKKRLSTPMLSICLFRPSATSPPTTSPSSLLRLWTPPPSPPTPTPPASSSKPFFVPFSSPPPSGHSHPLFSHIASLTATPPRDTLLPPPT